MTGEHITPTPSQRIMESPGLSINWLRILSTKPSRDGNGEQDEI
jgi:hypothetical protein